MNKQEITKAKYVNELLDITDNLSDFTHSDLQAVLEATVTRIAGDENLLSFETRLQRSRASDLQ